jgi:hypothetical protein
LSRLRKFVVLFLVVLVVLVSVVGVVWYIASGSTEDDSLEFPPERGPVPEPYKITFSSMNLEVVQGESGSINITVTSVVHQVEANMIFSWYLGTYQNQSWSSTDTSPLDVTFDPNQLSLKISEPKTTVMTINVAEDAPSGTYRIYLEPSTTAGTSGYDATIGVWITVIP